MCWALSFGWGLTMGMEPGWAWPKSLWNTPSGAVLLGPSPWEDSSLVVGEEQSGRDRGSSPKCEKKKKTYKEGPHPLPFRSGPRYGMNNTAALKIPLTVRSLVELLLTVTHTRTWGCRPIPGSCVELSIQPVHLRTTAFSTRPQILPRRPNQGYALWCLVE